MDALVACSSCRISVYTFTYFPFSVKKKKEEFLRTFSSSSRIPNAFSLLSGHTDHGLSIEKVIRSVWSFQVAGFARPISQVSPSVAEEALEQLKNKLDSLESELEDLKAKV